MRRELSMLPLNKIEYTKTKETIYVKSVEKISCVNSAAFVMGFSIYYLDEETGETKAAGWTSGNYPVGQERTCDLAKDAPEIPDGAIVWAHVHAVLGKSNDGTPKLKKDSKNGQVGTYRVTGTTLIYDVKLIG